MNPRRVWLLTDPDLPEELHIVRDIFMAEPGELEQVGMFTNRQAPAKKDEPPKRNNDANGVPLQESLHDYFTRKSLMCFCRQCVAKRPKKKH